MVRWVLLLAILSPLWLGPALTPALVALAEVHHVCECGMPVGTCGCPECELLEGGRSRHEASSPFSVLTGECQHGPTVLSGVSVPPTILPPSTAQMLAAPGQPLATDLRPRWTSLPSQAPPRRPPRPGTSIVL